MKRIFTLAALAAFTLAANAETMTWDFTSTSDNDIELIEADIETNGSTNWVYSSESNGTIDRYTYQLAMSDEELTANGTALSLTSGLKFDTNNQKKKIRFDKNKRLGLNGSNLTLTIPSLTAGQKVTIVFASANSSEARTLSPGNLSDVSGFEAATSATTQTGTGTVTESGDVTFGTGSYSGINVFSITVEDATEEDGEENTESDDNDGDQEGDTENQETSEGSDSANAETETIFSATMIDSPTSGGAIADNMTIIGGSLSVSNSNVAVTSQSSIYWGLKIGSNSYYITVTPDETLKSGDEIAVTAFVSGIDASKKSGTVQVQYNGTDADKVYCDDYDSSATYDLTDAKASGEYTTLTFTVKGDVTEFNVYRAYGSVGSSSVTTVYVNSIIVTRETSTEEGGDDGGVIEDQGGSVGTAVSSIEAAEAVADEAEYNLAGQKVGPNYKGIVIKGGKKYLKK